MWRVHPLMKDANNRDAVVGGAEINHMPLDIAAAIAGSNMITRRSGLRNFGQHLECRGQQVVGGQMVVDEMRLAATAALNGIGIAYVFRQFVEANIKTGALKVVLEKNSPQRGMFHIYYPSNRQMPFKLRVFIDHIRAANWHMPKSR